MRRLLLAMSLLFALPAISWAWNHTGHMTVVRLAWAELSAEQRKAIGDVLAKHPHHAKYFCELKSPEGANEAEWNACLAAIWSDWLRGFSKAKDEEGKKIYSYHVGPRHYINWPFVLPTDIPLYATDDAKEKSFHLSLQRHIKKLKDPMEENIIVGLDRAIKELKDPATKDEDRAVALCWLFHLAGDIHQPLHNIGFFSNEYAQGDEGGNLRYVKHEDQPMPLHRFWDDLPGREESYTAEIFPKSFAKAKENMDLLSRSAFARNRYEKELLHKTPREWSEESMVLAIRHGYVGGSVPGIRVMFNQVAKKAHLAPPLPKAYVDEARAVGQRQIALAGHRLVDLMNDVFPKAAGVPK